MPIKVFIDSDVVISSLLSSTGAAFILLNNHLNLKLYISNFSQKELEEVAKRLKINQDKLGNLIKNKFEVINLTKSTEKLEEDFKGHVLDINDAHIVAGASRAKAKFLISYNTKHFKINQIKTDFKLIVITPANFLQYLRSL